MLKHNPSIIPRTHHLDQAISAWVDDTDCAPFRELAKATSEPFAANPKYSAPPLPHERITVTQCGT